MKVMYVSEESEQLRSKLYENVHRNLEAKFSFHLNIDCLEIHSIINDLNEAAIFELDRYAEGKMP